MPQEKISRIVLAGFMRIIASLIRPTFAFGMEATMEVTEFLEE